MSILKKSHNISLALIKLSVAARRAEFRRRLEQLAFELLEAGALKEFECILRILGTIKEFAEFGRIIYEIEPMNARILIEECGNFEEEIRQIAGLDEFPDIKSIIPGNQYKKSLHTAIASLNNDDEKAVFAGIEESLYEKEKLQKTAGININPAIAEVNPAIDIDSDNPAIESGNDTDSATIRQSSVVEMIRQSGNQNTQFKDLLAAFPSISERTLRYDLKKLCDHRILERFGQGGPGTYYKVRVL